MKQTNNVTAKQFDLYYHYCTQQSVTRVVLEVDDISPEVKSLHVDLNCFLETNFPRHV